MTSLTSLAEAEALLAQYVPLSKEITGRDITLDRTKSLISLLGNPEKRLKVIHVAGTSGKTSTAYYIASLLTSAGQKVGLTVSPHIDSVTERVQINMQPLSESEFLTILNEYMQILESSDIKPTYFELLIGFAYWYFAKASVDYAVIETGMGGLHDSTNVAENSDKICVITDIGLDHMHVLGHTVHEIAQQKAGIIHDGNTVFMHQQADEIMQIVKQQCTEKRAALHIVPELETSVMMPEFQRRNWSLAYAVFEFVRTRDGLPQTDTKKSQNMQVPGRMDAVSAQGKTIIMDGAHNEQKMHAFVTGFEVKYPNKKVPVLLSLKQGKELTAVLPLIKPITSKLIVTSYKTGQDLPVASIDTHELLAAAEKFGFRNVVAEQDSDKAYELLISEPSDIAVITGSFYLVSQLRHNHKELIHGSHN
jgi:dihydrofolate synthase/folylpolyglutamate synthase